MAKPYTEVYRITNPATGQELEITSLVIDRDEFDKLLDEIAAIDFTGGRIDPAMIADAKRCGQVQGLGRGTKTEFIFARYGITTDALGIIVRGTGRKLMEQMLAAADVRRN